MAEIHPDIRSKYLPPAARIAELASAQHGFVAHRQLIELGISRSGVQRRIETGQLHPVHMGVYCAGHRVHTRRLPIEEVSVLDGVPTTTVSRTFVDLAAVLSSGRLQRCLEEKTGLPMPEVNSIVEGYEVDFCWPDCKLIIELDGPGHHDQPGQVERDRIKDVRLALTGFVVHRFGTGRLYSAPIVVVGEAIALLGTRWQGLAPPSG